MVGVWGGKVGNMGVRLRGEIDDGGKLGRWNG